MDNSVFFETLFLESTKMNSLMFCQKRGCCFFSSFFFLNVIMQDVNKSKMGRGDLRPVFCLWIFHA